LAPHLNGSSPFLVGFADPGGADDDDVDIAVGSGLAAVERTEHDHAQRGTWHGDDETTDLVERGLGGAGERQQRPGGDELGHQTEQR
jgi:hypothetical protein